MHQKQKYTRKHGLFVIRGKTHKPPKIPCLILRFVVIAPCDKLLVQFRQVCIAMCLQATNEHSLIVQAQKAMKLHNRCIEILPNTHSHRTASTKAWMVNNGP
jgi:hypothetical protein